MPVHRFTWVQARGTTLCFAVGPLQAPTSVCVNIPFCEGVRLLLGMGLQAYCAQEATAHDQVLVRAHGECHPSVAIAGIAHLPAFNRYAEALRAIALAAHESACSICWYEPRAIAMRPSAN